MITDLKKLCLFAKLYISTGLLYKTSPLADDTSTNIDDGYKLDVLNMKDMPHLHSSTNGEFVLMQSPNDNVLMLQSVFFDELHKKMDETENVSNIDTLINDVNNLFMFAELDNKNSLVKNDNEIENNLVEINDAVPYQEASLDPTDRCGVTAENMAPMDILYPSDRFVRITGVGNYLIPELIIGHYCLVSQSTRGDCLCNYALYACAPEQPTSIHSVIQLNHYKNNVDNKDYLLGGSQLITMSYGRIFPLVFKKGLCYLLIHTSEDGHYPSSNHHIR